MQTQLGGKSKKLCFKKRSPQGRSLKKQRIVFLDASLGRVSQEVSDDRKANFKRPWHLFLGRICQ